ncbi:MAG: ArsR/SmtB family transcription factor [Candidatus Odinarchaeia archaeon]
METIEKEIYSLKKQLTNLEGVKIDVTGLKLMIDKVLKLLQESPPEKTEAISSSLKDEELIINESLDRVIFETVSTSRKIKSGVVFLSSAKFVANQAIPVHNQVIKFDSYNIIEDDEETAIRVSNYLSALSNVKRIKILAALAERDRSSKEIQELTGKKGGSLYHHLNELLSQKLIQKIGNNYGLTENGKEILIILGLINQQTKFLEEQEKAE